MERAAGREAELNNDVTCFKKNEGQCVIYIAAYCYKVQPLSVLVWLALEAALLFRSF